MFHLNQFWTFRTMADPEQGGNRRAAIAGLAIAVVGRGTVVGSRADREQQNAGLPDVGTNELQCY